MSGSSWGPLAPQRLSPCSFSFGQLMHMDMVTLKTMKRRRLDPELLSREPPNSLGMSKKWQLAVTLHRFRREIPALVIIQRYIWPNKLFEQIRTGSSGEFEKEGEGTLACFGLLPVFTLTGRAESSNDRMIWRCQKDFQFLNTPQFLPSRLLTCHAETVREGDQYLNKSPLAFSSLCLVQMHTYWVKKMN